ncbi:helix-turn-helix transcriptional regulator [Methanocella conradii]|uniref:helix-turn-helix transcriptional regulator n=1 Tax=Methanocella conradii TaxID=1175444 RepID=UPI0024B342F8|nr:hypothetical protein [Methanocella conradii]MDI6897521.1 hypothetical protein [Methanocella conradii]
MNRISLKLALILLASLCIVYMAAPLTAASSTVIKVEVLPGGDSRWTTEKLIPLDTPGEVAGWDATASQNIERYKAEFEGRMKDYVARISAAVDRPMSIKDVNVTVEKAQPYALSDNASITYGVVRYEFTWTGFAMSAGGSLEVGDAFVDGFLLNNDDSITFILPAEYTIKSVSPACDEMRDSYQPQVKWMGRSANGTEARLFSSGEPAIIMERMQAPAFSVEWWALVPVSLISAALGFAAAYTLFRRRRSRTPEETYADGDMPMPDSGSVTPSPALDEGRYMSDEEKIIKYLEEAGGQMFQSDLVRKTSFSKSKLSMVLSGLKDKGMIVKIKKGKENLIRLNRPPEGPVEDGK